MIPPRSRCTLPPAFMAGFGALLLGLPAIGQPAIDLEEETEDDEGGRLPAMEMLMDGSILNGIMIPQYDESLRLSSLLRADTLVLVNDKTIEATKAQIEFYHIDQTPRGRIDLETATLHNQRLLRSADPVQIRSEDMNSSGSALVYDLENAQGFLSGPTETQFSTDPLTAMNHPTPRSFGLAGLTLMAAAGLHAAPPEPLSEQAVQGLDRLAESRAEEFKATAAEGQTQLDAATKQSAKADATLEAFLEDAALEAPKGKPVDLTTEVPGPKGMAELENPATIRSKDGLYFDSQEGILIFLTEVSVDHPEFILTGADEVKVFMEKEEEDPDKKPEDPPTEGIEKVKAEDEEDAFGSAKFGDPKKIVATGVVVVERKILKKGDKKAKASGREMVMDLDSNEVIIRGGNPWIMSDTANGRVVDSKGYIRINLKTGDASFVGDSEGFVETKNLDK